MKRKLLMLLCVPLVFLAMGGTLNGVVRSRNGGKMPVVGPVEQEGMSLDERHVVGGPHTKYAALGDVYLIGEYWMSPGDLVLNVGYGVGIFVLMIVIGMATGHALRRSQRQYPVVTHYHHD